MSKREIHDADVEQSKNKVLKTLSENEVRQKSISRHNNLIPEYFSNI